MDELKRNIGQSSGWFALYTAPRAEKKVADRLQKAGVDCWLPLLKVQRVWSDRVKVVEVPMFSSYVFVHCRVEALRPLLEVDGVVKVVWTEGEPARIRDKEISEIRKFIELSQICTIEDGDIVEILCGNLKRVYGKVMRIKKTHLYLYLGQLGAIVCVKLSDVKKIS